MKSSSPYHCSVVIPAKNGGELFLEVLQGLQTQTCWDRVQLIVIDSGSSDETVKLAVSVGALVREIPAAEFNHGATRDLGIALADSDNVILLVQDAVPYDEQLLERLVAALEEPGVAGAYARQIPREDADVLTKRNLNQWLTGRIKREVRAIRDVAVYDRLSPQEKYFFCNFDNVCSAIKKSVWAREKFGTINFGEDVDWSERVLKAGYAIVYEPAAAVIHSHDRSLWYEYKRTYLCHRKLVQQFDLRLTRNLKNALILWVWSTIKDVLYAVKNERNVMRMLKLIVTAPALNFLIALAQYKSQKHELAGLDIKIQDV